MASASFAPIRHRSFALSLVSSFVSSTGTWMQTVALGVYLTETTHNPQWLGLLTVAAWSPALIGSPLGGVIADRWSRQRWIQLNNLVMAVTASALATAALTKHLTPQLACYLALVEGLASSASWSAWQSLLPDLVERDEVLAAVSLSSAQFNLGRIIGPMLAGVALAFGSPGLCFALNAASFVFVVIIFSFVRSAPRPKPTTKIHVWAETVVGIKQAWAVRGCRYPIIAVGTVAIIASPFIALVPAMAIQTLHAGKVGVSWLVTAQGVGAVLGAVTLPALAYVGTLTGLNTAVQLHAPLSERSRILSLYTLSLSIFYPVGALAQASFAKSWGVRPVTVVAAGVLALALVAVTALRPAVWVEMGSTPTALPVLLAE
jgi:MFS family permease